MNEHESITELAYRALTDSELLSTKYLTIEDVIAYLKDDSNFKSLSAQLKETMIKKGVCTEDDDMSVFVIRLYELLYTQDEAQTESHKRTNDKKKPTPWYEKIVKRWFSGEVSYIKKRQDLISIIFALKLSLTEATEFLNKCGYSILNVRDPEDAVYIYCLLNKKSLSDAYSILDRFNEATKNSSFSESEKSTKLDIGINKIGSVNGNTTYLLMDQILKSSWENDDDFLKTYLLKNKDSFISYSKTALREYHRLKNPLYFQTLRKCLINEEEEYRQRLKEVLFCKKNKISIKDGTAISINENDVEVSYKFVSTIRAFARYVDKTDEEYKDSISFWKDADDMLIAEAEVNNGATDLTDIGAYHTEYNYTEVLDTIEKYAYSHLEDDIVQSTVSLFLTTTVTASRMFDEWLPSISKLTDESTEDGRYRRQSIDYFDQNILHCFPKRQIFTRFENSPDKLTHDLTLRKTIILLYYINYAADYVKALSDPEADYGAETNFKGLKTFIKQLNALLESCQLGVLYPANHFDFLIMRSIIEIEVCPPFTDEEPIKFFSDALKLIFGDELDED